MKEYAAGEVKFEEIRDTAGPVFIRNEDTEGPEWLEVTSYEEGQDERVVLNTSIGKFVFDEVETFLF